MKKISDFLPKRKSGMTQLVQVKIDSELRAAVKAKMKQEGVSWHDFFVAACKLYLNESPSKK